MSTLDTMTPLISPPWLDASGKPLPVRALPGLRPEVLKTLESAYPGIVGPALRDLLSTCCGLADTDLGHIDFTGCCFPEEPCTVFNPCLTLAIDDTGRRWIAELRDGALPGPIWCIFPRPEVAVYVSEDLAAFLSSLREHASGGHTVTWLRELTATAQAIWSHRRTSALRPYNAGHTDDQIRGWLSSLPSDAYVYDLRGHRSVRGWPYGVAGPSARLYRCGHLPVFAAAGSPTEGWRSGHRRTTSPIYPAANLGLSFADTAPFSNWRMPSRHMKGTLASGANVSAWMASGTPQRGRIAPSELPLCA
jgi:hypothetical protein